MKKSKKGQFAKKSISSRKDLTYKEIYGEKRSKKIKEKIGRKSKGRKGYWKKKSLSKEHRRKISEYEKGKKVPKEVREKISRATSGNKHTQWQGGEIYRQNYYYLHNSLLDYRKKNKGYTKRARIIMERKIGRNLKKGEIVHHINGNKTNDKIENLYLFHNKGSHTQYESNLRQNYYVWIKEEINNK